MLSNTPVEALLFRVWFDFPKIESEGRVSFYLLINQREYGPYPTTIKTTPYWVQKPVLHPHPIPRFNIDRVMSLEAKLLKVWQDLPSQPEAITGEMIMQRFKQLPKTRTAKGGAANAN